MLSEKMEKAFNDQLNAEAYSGYLYLSMASYFEEKNLSGMAHWMKIQAREEFFHTFKFYNQVVDRGGRVKLQAVDAPQVDWESPLAAFEDAYKHELKVTRLINDLMNLARSETDHASEVFLGWFVTEQVEEEAAADAIVRKLKLVGDTGPGLFMVDQELSQRVISASVTAFLTGQPIPA